MALFNAGILANFNKMTTAYSFLYFVGLFKIQLVENVQCIWWYSKWGLLVSKATTLPAEPSTSFSIFLVSVIVPIRQMSPNVNLTG